MDTFVKRLKSLREKKQLSQKELASHIGVARATVASWETGRREPDYETAKILAEFFGVSVDYLLGSATSPRFYVTGGNKYNLDESLDENGQKSIYLSTAKRIAKALGKSVDFLWPD